MKEIRVLRVYEEPGRTPGEHRVLVDRLWPRGVRKDALDYDEWPKEVAPSSTLRAWYGHEPERFGEFSCRYRKELDQPPAAPTVARLRDLASRQQVVLLTATRDVEHSGAVVLAASLSSHR